MTVAVTIGHLQAATRPTGKLASPRITVTHVAYLYVTKFVKIDPNHTGNEIHYIAEHCLNSCINQKRLTDGRVRKQKNLISRIFPPTIAVCWLCRSIS